MTPPITWHPPEEQLQSYVDAGLPGLSAASVEAHLLCCDSCRTRVAGAVEQGRLIEVKGVLDGRLDQRMRPWPERLLLWLRVDEIDARALLAAPSLRRAWWLAVVGAAVLALVVAGNDTSPDALYLVLAPLVPLVATGAAYAPSLDEAFALVTATPYSMTRLIVARSVAVGMTAVTAVLIASVALPSWDAAAVAWLLPAVALTLLVLVLSARLGAELSTAGVSAGWLTVVGVLERGSVDSGWITAVGTQAAAAVVVGAGVVVLARQWSGIGVGGTR